MSRTAMPAWYMAMGVNAPCPVTSPTAHSFSPARIHSSTVTAPAVLSSPRLSTPRADRSDRRPTDTSGRSARRSTPAVTVNRSPSYATPDAPTPVYTEIPSASSASCTRVDASGSSIGSSRSMASTTVTATPNRAYACASSNPTAPPPSTSIDAGSVLASTASRLVQYGVPASPWIGGMTGAVPVASTTPRRASYVAPSTSTVPTPVSRPRPRTNRPPLPSNRSTATWSFQSSVASSRIRAATGSQSGATSACPAMPSTRRASATRWPPRITILVGTRPQYGPSPPTSVLSTPTTASPASASRPATSSPPTPRPRTTTSTCSVIRYPSFVSRTARRSASVLIESSDPATVCSHFAATRSPQRSPAHHKSVPSSPRYSNVVPPPDAGVSSNRSKTWGTGPRTSRKSIRSGRVNRTVSTVVATSRPRTGVWSAASTMSVPRSSTRTFSATARGCFPRYVAAMTLKTISRGASIARTCGSSWRTRRPTPRSGAITPVTRPTYPPTSAAPATVTPAAMANIIRPYGSGASSQCARDHKSVATGHR